MEQFILINKNKKGQVWSLDLVIATFLFLVGLIMLFMYAINYSTYSQEHLDELFYEGKLAAELILSDDNFGILTNDRVNQTKLDEYNISYSGKKDDLGVIHDFYFKMEGLNVNGIPKDYLGRMNTSATTDLIEITRVTIYESKPVKFELYIYNEE